MTKLYMLYYIGKDIGCGCIELLVSLIINSVTCVINCVLLTYLLVKSINYKKNSKKHMLYYLSKECGCG